MVDGEEETRRRLSKRRSNAKAENPSSCHMLLVHTCHHFHLHVLLEPSLLQPLSKAAFHKELDDSCVCGENQGFIFLSSEVSEHGDACHHLTRWGCKVSHVQAGDFFA